MTQNDYKNHLIGIISELGVSESAAITGKSVSTVYRWFNGSSDISGQDLYILEKEYKEKRKDY